MITTGKEYYPQYETHFDVDSPTSFYDAPDPVVLNLIGEIPVGSLVLELAAGDGRYTLPMLQEGLRVYATDLEEAPLAVLREKARRKSLNNLSVRSGFNVFDGFAVKDGVLDAVVCTGFLYLFPEHYVEHVVTEASRVTSDKGIFIADFVTDRVRTDSQGHPITGAKEMSYSLAQGMSLMNRVLTDKGFQVRTVVNTLDVVMDGGIRVRGNKLNIIGRKIWK